MKMVQRRFLKRKFGINLFVYDYLFPNIKIRVINRITNIIEIESQTIAMSFKKKINKQIK